ncbi:MAG: hypothetical protein JWN02_2140 [Acidobacteria bacterium]|nr:hypothetical protein [Acidobacteriota bacterium]
MLSARRAGVILLAAAALTPLLLASGLSYAKEGRTHWKVINARGETYFVVTEIKQLDESEDHTLYLVTDGDDRLVIEMTQSYWQQKSIKEIRDLKSKAFIRMEYRYPYKSKTRSTTIAEAKSSPAKMHFDPEVTFAASGYARTAHESEWKAEPNARVWRSELRKSADPMLIDHLERMRGTLFSAHPQLRSVCDQLVSRFLYGEPCGKNGAGEIVEIQPDCFFDAEFGYSCTASQKAHADSARRSDAVPAFY